MSMFGSQSSGPTPINTVKVNQSVLGFCVPVVMGKNKVQQTILWLDGFKSAVVPQSGGKGFGGKGSNQLTYSADVIAALCNGGPNGLVGIGDVWSGQSWLKNTNGAESYTVSGGSPSYTPVNAAHMTGDLGVGYTVAVSASYADLGAPAPTALATSLLVPFNRVPYVGGTAPGAGQYSVNPSTGAYYFSPSDAGVTLQLFYTYALSTVTRQENVIIPSSLSVQVGDSSTGSNAVPWSADLGVTYYNTGATNGQALTDAYGTPYTAGTYSVSAGSLATYHFAPGDVNQEVQITWQVNNSLALPAGTQTSLSFTVEEGTPGQAPWALLLSNYPGAALGYTGIVLVLFAPMDLGYGAQIQQNIYEVITADGWGSGVPDCNPVQCVMQVLSNPVWGLGAGKIPFPTSAIDNGTGGTWGSGNAGNSGNGAQAALRPVGGPVRPVPYVDQTATSWFAANNFFISPVIDKQDTAASLMGRWLEAGMCAAFMSEGLMKLVPYGDTSAAANGATWTAPSAYDAVLDDSCFLKKSGQDPVKVTIPTDYMSAWNTVQVSWSNRGNQYAPEITPESDKAAINRYGTRIEDPQTWDFITTLPAVIFAASMRLKRSVYTRNQYTFSLPFRYGYLEPMGLLSITTSSAWFSTNNTLAIINRPVRITKIVDNPDGTYDLTCEDYAFGTQQPSAFNKVTSTPQPAPNQFADPGPTQAVVFATTDRLVAFGQRQIWIGANGGNEAWGGCNVYASMDGTKYTQLGTVTAPARLGTLGAALPSGADPDTTDLLVVNLVQGSAALESGTTADADQGNTLCYVDGELMSYSTCSITGPDQYTAGGYIRRGQMGSSVAAHASGGQFLRLDDAVLKYTYDPSWAGKTVYLKFQSFNHFDNSAQDMSTLTPLTFNVPGAGVGIISVSGTTINPTVSTTALTDLPELGSSNPAMTFVTNGNAGQITLSLEFEAWSSGGSGGAVQDVGFTPSPVYGSVSPPSISISVTGDGTGASAGISWTPSGGSYPYGPPSIWTPSLHINGGTGYTHATATVTVSNAVGGYTNGTSTYSCTVSAGTGTLQSGVPVQVRVLMDGLPVIGPTTELTGPSIVTTSQAVFPSAGSHSFEVQALNLDATYLVESINRTFQYVPLG